MGEEREGLTGSGERRAIYCLIPYELAPRLHDPLRRHFRAMAGIEVVVDRRRGERRSEADRRAEEATRRAVATASASDEESSERRAIRNVGGRRVGDRRAAAVPVPAEERPPLPRKARAFADRITFVERLKPASEASEDLDTARLVIRYQAGEGEAFNALYVRYFDRVYGYLRVLLPDPYEAEDATQDVFERLMTSLADYERTGKPFRAWLFTVVRNRALEILRKSTRVEVVDTATLDAQLEQVPDSSGELSALDWISEQDLFVLVEHLPAEQRQVLALRYVLDLKPPEIAEVLGLSANHVSVLHYRAITFLRKRLENLGRRAVQRGRRARMRSLPQRARVLRNRRFALRP